VPPHRLLSWLALFACAACQPERSVEVVPAFAESCLEGRAVANVRLRALGDFPPSPESIAAAPPDGRLRLVLPPGTQAISVEGVGSAGLVAFGRSAPFGPAGAPERLGIAYGPPRTLCRAARLRLPRAGHRATVLSDGRVVVTGGVDEGGFPVGPLELYLPSGDALAPSGSFRLVDGTGGAPTTIDARAALGHAVAALEGGRFVVTGGAPASRGIADGIASEGLTEHRSDGTLAGPPRLLGGGPRAFHSATVLADGRVLLAGGCAELEAGRCSAGRALETTMLLDPATWAASPGPRLLRARWGHTAIRRGDGAVVLVGGESEGGALPPVEIVDPDEPRGSDLLVGGTTAAPTPAGTLLVVDAGDEAGGRARLRALAGDGTARDLGSLATALLAARAATLDDGALFLSGDDAPGRPAESVVLDGTGMVTARFALGRSGHALTAMLDGTVLVSGGLSSTGGAVAEALVYLHTPLGPYDTPPILGFDGGPLDGGGTPIVPSLPDAARVVDGRLEVRAASAGEGGRPGAYALVGAVALAGGRVSLLLGRRAATEVALLVGWRSEADYDAISVEAGRAPALVEIRPGRTGQSIVTRRSDGCTAQPLTDGDLPDGALAPFALTRRHDALELAASGRVVLRCTYPAGGDRRGLVGVGVFAGTALADNLAVER
jgi:hypothetical protein